MSKIKFITGINKTFINTRIKIGVFFHFIKYLIDGKIKFNKFIAFLRRLLLFLKIVKNNKFIQINNNIKLDMYIPEYPTKAFYTACEKFLEFEKDLPCITVLLSVTKGCAYNCDHCYQKKDLGKDIDINVLIDTVKKLQDMNISFFNIEGGEPFLTYDRLLKVCKSIDDRSEIWVNSTGYGITVERLLELKEHNVKAIMFSLHHDNPDDFNNFMGSIDAYKSFISGIESCHKANMNITFNSCLLKDDFYNGKFERVIELAKKLKGILIQLIVPKPSGAWLGKFEKAFDENDLNVIRKKVNLYNNDINYKDYPAILSQAIEEDENHFGCTAGGVDRFYINAKGDVQPCEFLNISFGNVQDEDFLNIYERMRKVFLPAKDCLMCEKTSKKIYEAFNKNKDKKLPLSRELSHEIYSKWERGKNTLFYEKIKNIK